MSFELKKELIKKNNLLIEKWVFKVNNPILTKASIDDIYNNDEEKIIFGTKKGDVFCLNLEGKEEWRFLARNSLNDEEAFFYDEEKINSIRAEPIIKDLDHDGEKEIIISSENGTVYCLNPFGKEKWNYSTNNKIKAPPLIIDYNFDGVNEILIPSDKLHIIDSSGKGIAIINTNNQLEATPNVIKGNNGKETILIIPSNNELIAINLFEEKKWSFKAEGKITAKPIIINDKILFGDWKGFFYALNYKGELLWKFETEGSIYESCEVGDINNDGVKEIIFGSCDNKIYALNNNGELLWKFETDFWVVAKPLIADLNKDGEKEIISGSYDKNIYILKGKGNNEIKYMPGISSLIAQPETQTELINKSPVEQEAVLLAKKRIQGMITGLNISKKNKVIVTTSEGIAEELDLKKKNKR